MSLKNNKFYSFILVIVDIFVLLMAFLIAYAIRTQFDNRPLVAQVYAWQYFSSALLIVPFWILIFGLLGLYSKSIYSRRLSEWSRIAIGSFIGILFVIGWEYASDTVIMPARLVAVYALVASILLIIVEREIIRQIRNILFKFEIGIKRVLIIGDSDATADIAKNLSNTAKSGYKIVAIVCPAKNFPKNIGAIHYSRLELAVKDVRKNKINTIIQTDLYDSSIRNQLILGAAQTNHIEYSFIPGEAEFYSGKNTVDVFAGYPMITVYQTPLVGWGAIFKRIFDQLVSLLLIIVLSPLLIILFLIKKIADPGPAFYISKRLSRFSQPINLIKFRSMSAKYGSKDAAEEFKEMGRDDLAKEYQKFRKVENDPRITKFGKFLRDTSLDELPQLFNVVRGDLSLVGPRPILPQEMNMAKGKAALLHSVKSGVTGLWQVSGRSELSFEERIELELYYAQNWSFWLDIKILLKTILVVIQKKGAK